jgi:thioredoxin-like negative regulator of GroEL
MRPSVRRLEEEYGDRIDFDVLNVDQASTNALAAQYNVTGIPMIVLLDAQGQTVKTLIGFQTDDQLDAAVALLLDGS